MLYTLCVLARNCVSLENVIEPRVSSLRYNKYRIAARIYETSHASPSLSLSLSLRSKVSIHTWSSHFMNCPVNRHLIAGRSAKKVNDGGQLNEIFVSINPTRYHYY